MPYFVFVQIAFFRYHYHLQKTNQIIIGEFFPQPVMGSRAFVSIYSKEPIHGECVLLNRFHESTTLKEFDLTAEGDALELELSNCESGHYQVVINIDGHKFNRNLLIEHG